MNTPNNARRQHSRDKLIDALLQQLRTKELSEIRVQELCRIAEVNRSTFYACFSDIYDLAQGAQKKLELDASAAYGRKEESDNQTELFLQLFRYIADHQELYKTYFKLGFPAPVELSGADQALAEKYYGGQDVDYHIAFFRAGLNAVVEKWLSEGCRRTPEEINRIIALEYHPKGNG